MSMPKAALAAVAVLVLAVSGFMLLGRPAEPPGAVGAPASASPSPMATVTTAPTATPVPSEVAPGITGWTPFTSEVYGITLSVPNGWRTYSAATRKWQSGDQPDYGSHYLDLFVNPSDRDGEDIALAVYQRPAGSGADITSREGIAAWFQANVCDEGDACETTRDVAEPMCVGRTACLPAILMSMPGGVHAAFADADTGLVTIVSLGRHDDFPATSRYGGGVQLLKSILTTMDVWTPEPGQVPSGG